MINNSKKPPQLLNSYLKVCFLCLAAATISFLPIIVYNLSKGYDFNYVLDFNNQTIPYNMYMVHCLRSGTTFSWSTDLGSGFLNSFACNGLFSPFFFPLLLLPENAIPWALSIMMIIKFAMAGGGAYLWIRGKVENDDCAILAGLLYAFSGQMIYNVIYYFFLDSFALFPYAMAALDKLLYSEKKGIYWLMVAVYAATNYMFFTETVVFVILYTVCVFVFDKIENIPHRIGLFLLESIGGTCCGAFVLVPSAIYMLSNHRATSHLLGTDILFYPETKTYLSIVKGLFLAPDGAGISNLFTSGQLQWSPPTLYIPLIGISGIIAFHYAKSHPTLLKIFYVCLAFAFVPILNSAFLLFNATYYARWFFMPSLILCGVSAQALDSKTVRTNYLKKASAIVLIATACFAVFSILPSENKDNEFRIGVVENQLIYWMTLVISILGAYLFFRIIRSNAETKKQMESLITAALFVSVLCGMGHFLSTYATWYTADEYNAATKDLKENVRAVIPESETKDARYDYFSEEQLINPGLWVRGSCIQSYSSTVASSIADFYNSFYISRSVASSVDPQFYAFRGLLSVKYQIVPKSNNDEWEKAQTQQENDDDGVSIKLKFWQNDSKYAFETVALQGWTQYAETDEYYIYKNDNFVPMGYYYDYYITETQLDGITQHLKANALVKAVLLNESQIDEFSDLVAPISDSELEMLDYDAYKQDCATNANHAVLKFEQTKSGFVAKSDYDSDKLVFFSVPYDGGFSASIDGVAAPFEKVDNGLIAMRVPCGEHQIEFTYHTLGLKEGIAISITGLIVWILYALVCYNKGKKKGKSELQEVNKSPAALE